MDSGLPQVAPPLADDVVYLSASDEHGRLLLADDAGPAAEALGLGDKLRLIPGHCDPTVNMYRLRDIMMLIESLD
eukprot:COSAG01_NODE_26344_length_717_cov_0.713592_2_plen_75_part_00